MQVTDKYTIAYKGLKNGSHDYHFEVGKALFESYGSEEIHDGACLVDVRLERSETQLVADVKITGSVVVECDRCLEDCSIPIDFEGRLLIKFSDELREYDGEVMWLSPLESEVDLAQYIYESIVLSLPYQRVHPEGQCDPEMLERFRIITGQEFAALEAEAEAEQHKGGDWDKLAELKEQMEAGKKPKAPKNK